MLRDRMDKVVVIGAGVGGLVTAAVLARAGLQVTVLEAHVYPGGCAGTFYHQGYRFDAGATLAGGFYPNGPMDIVGRITGVASWPTRPAEPTMVAHLPQEISVARFGDERRWEEYARAFGQQSLSFFKWQERTADVLWELALRLPPWPPQTPEQVIALARDSASYLWRDTSPTELARLLRDATSPLSVHLQRVPDSLRRFIDAQLLISAQATSAHANALYGAAALDLPRRGVVHLTGGMGSIATELARAVQRNDGKVLYRQEVNKILLRNGKPRMVQTRKGEQYEADLVVANIPLENIHQLLNTGKANLRPTVSTLPGDGWGAFVVYLGVNTEAVQDNLPLHHQVVLQEPLGEGNSIFMSISPPWDASRAPLNRRTITISTHTNLSYWWHLWEQERAAYDARVEEYTQRLLAAAEIVIPDLRRSADLILPGTPVTFQRFTRRARGWVGGYPQTSLFRTRGPKISDNLWMVGDSIFPGQSTAAVALGGLRVAANILAEHKIMQPAEILTMPALSPHSPERQPVSQLVIEGELR